MTGKPQPHLTVIMPVYRNEEQARRCIGALTDATDLAIDLVLVIHHEGDKGLELNLAQPHSCTIVPGTPDLWWTGAMNLGIRHAMKNHPDELMLINSDCLLHNRDAARLLAQSQQHPDAIICPAQDELQTDRPLFTRATDCYLLGFPVINLSHWFPSYGKSRPQQTQLIIGGRGVIIPTDILDRIGLFDETTFPHYAADNDFYLRCRKQGIRLLVTGDVRIQVDQSTTSLATDPGRLSFRDFLDTLRHRRSHRNLADMKQLYRRYYPIPLLYPLGIALNLARYLIIYLVKRGRYLIQHR